MPPSLKRYTYFGIVASPVVPVPAVVDVTTLYRARSPPDVGTMAHMDITVEDRPTENRYVALDGDDVVGFAAYERRDDVVVLTHTVVQPEAEGRGVGSSLARTALDAARAAGTRVVPQCEFMAAWIERHPDYADLVTGP